MKIFNPDNLPEAFIAEEIKQVEAEKKRRVRFAEFHRVEDDAQGNPQAREVFRFEVQPFNRLRRITGYLVGDLSRWNDGKRAEQRDRVKHGAG